MNNKHLSWYKEINNNFIIASRAYLFHTIIAENSENDIDVPSDMDVNMVFALPAEFRAPEAEIAELVLDPKNATFHKPEGCSP